MHSMPIYRLYPHAVKLRDALGDAGKILHQRHIADMLVFTSTPPLSACHL